MDSTRWDDRYAESELVWSAGPNEFLPPLVEGLEPGTALDIACGEGRNAIWLARHGWTVTGIDFSPVGIAKARRLAGQSTITWLVADATTWEPEESFDLVIVFYLQLPAEPFAGAIRMAVEAVAPGGVLFGVGHGARNLGFGYGGPQDPEVLWREDEIRPLLTGLDIIELGERERSVEEADATAIDVVVHAVRPT
ncbi:MAG: class I SAM-dependent methyltransferase [Acidimicrobiia bacterium]